MERSSRGGRGVDGVIEEGYRADLIVENNVALKSLETLLPVHAKQGQFTNRSVSRFSFALKKAFDTGIDPSLAVVMSSIVASSADELRSVLGR
jgi:hypothetical protein